MQVLVYGAIAVAVLLVGVRWVRGGDPSRASGAGVSPAPATGARPPGEVSVAHDAGDLVVHVAGAVRHPGVYRLPDGSRVTDAIERAGGPAADATVDAINLAARLADGQQVQVPGRSAAVTPAAGGPAAATGPISLGAATLEQLDTIDGIGPVTAQDILDFRDDHGGVASIDQLDQISGIGPATMEALRDGLQP
jgi:competence protein ComEA